MAKPKKTRKIPKREAIVIQAAKDGVADQLRVWMEGLVHALVLHGLDAAYVRTGVCTRMCVRACKTSGVSEARGAHVCESTHWLAH